MKNHQNKYLFTENLKLNECELKHVDKIKFLGVILDQSLSWNDQTNEICRKMRSNIGYLFKLRNYVTKKALIDLYFAFINCHLSYCTLAWGVAGKVHLNKIFLLQKRILRMIFFKHNRYHTISLFQEANGLDIFKLYKLKLALHAHSLFYNNRERPPIIKKYPTRYNVSLDLPVERMFSASGSKALPHQAALIWNELPKDLRGISSVINFKRRVKMQLINQC